jgi:hypothetical protein
VAFAWDASTGRYRDVASGRMVRESAARSALDQVIGTEAQQMRDLSQMLLDGKIALSAWQVQMMVSIKSVHLIGVSLASGGWSNLDQSDFGFVGQRIRSQYAYLRDFANQIESGKQPLNGTVLARATMYAEAGRATHRAAQRRAAQQRGMEQEKNQLGAADHCAGCLSATAAGWVEIGTLVPCGSRQCLSRCHCSLTYRTVPAA